MAEHKKSKAASASAHHGSPAKPADKKTSTKASKSGEGAKSSSGAKARKPQTQSAAPANPMFDTSSAAAAAAKIIKHGAMTSVSGEQTPATSGEKRESSAFKQLKQSVQKPAASGVASFLQSTAPQRKSGLPFMGGNQQQRGRNQTFGADVNRTGVPRRTGG